MNRAMWIRILTVAVLAPYLYKQSMNEKGYFAVGLKLFAGSLIATNIIPLMNDAEILKRQAQTIVANLVKAQETIAQNNLARVVVDVNAEEVSEGEFAETG